jgi:hypothetical protein
MGHRQQPLLGDFESVLVQLGLSEGLLIILFTIGEVADERKGLLVIFAHDRGGGRTLERGLSCLEPTVPKPTGRVYECSSIHNS